MLLAKDVSQSGLCWDHDDHIFYIYVNEQVLFVPFSHQRERDVNRVLTGANRRETRREKTKNRGGWRERTGWPRPDVNEGAPARCKTSAHEHHTNDALASSQRPVSSDREAGLACSPTQLLSCDGGLLPAPYALSREGLGRPHGW